MPDDFTARGWRLWLDCSRSPSINMASDDILLQKVLEWGTVLRFYGWDRAALSIGYFQPISVADKVSCAVIRRPSGGGVVDHRHDLTFSLVVPAGHPLFIVDRFECYQLINEAVCSALMFLDPELHTHQQDTPATVDRRQLICFDTPARYDVIGSEGKICGGAQRRRSYGMLHQASIRLDRLPQSPPEALRNRLIASLSLLLPGPSEYFESSEGTESEIQRLALEQYENPEWNARR